MPQATVSARSVASRPGRSRPRSSAPSSDPSPRAATATAEAEAIPAEQHLPLAVVVAHGLLAVITVVLVLLAAIGV